MSDISIDTSGIERFSITTQLTSPVTAFSMDYSSAEWKSWMDYGNFIKFAIQNLYGATANMNIKAQIETFKETVNPEGVVWNFGGRNKGLFLVQQPIYFPCVNGFATECIQIASAMSRPVNYKKEEIDLGTFEVNYQGQKVYIAGCCGGTANINVDDILRISANNRTIEEEYTKMKTVEGKEYYDCMSGTFPKAPLEISSILKPGENQVNVVVADHCGNHIGHTDLYFAGMYITDKVQVQTYTFLEILDRILLGTGVIRSADFNSFNQIFTNDASKPNWFCNMKPFSTKAEAIDFLMYRYCQLNRIKPGTYRGYVDANNMLRCINIYDDKNSLFEIDVDDKNVVFDYAFDGSIESVRNWIYGVAGQDSDISSKMEDSYSIEHYGRRVADSVVATDLSSVEELNDKLSYELDYLSKPIVNVSLTMQGFNLVEPGVFLRFPFKERYADLRFIVSTVTHTGDLSNYLTTINATTDLQFVLHDEILDLIMQILKDLQSEANENTNCPEEVLITDKTTDVNGNTVVGYQTRTPEPNFTGNVGTLNTTNVNTNFISPVSQVYGKPGTRVPANNILYNYNSPRIGGQFSPLFG